MLDPGIRQRTSFLALMSTPKAANTLDRLRRFYILLMGLQMLGVSHKPIAGSGDPRACHNIEQLLRRF